MYPPQPEAMGFGTQAVAFLRQVAAHQLACLVRMIRRVGVGGVPEALVPRSRAVAALLEGMTPCRAARGSRWVSHLASAFSQGAAAVFGRYGLWRDPWASR